MQKEEWRDVKKYPELYSVSNLGRVYSKLSNKILTSYVNKNGYEQISTRYENKNLHLFVHRLVGECFVENIDNKPFINHIDCNKTNNIYTNLEWCTAKENSRHAVDTKLVTYKRGIENKLFKLTQDQLDDIKRNYIKGCGIFGARAFGRKFGVSHSVILKAVDIVFK